MNTSSQRPYIREGRNHPYDSRELAAPSVAAAFHDEDNEGLLPISALSQPVEVTFEVWAGARPKDIYQLLWNETSVGEVKEISDSEQVGDPLTLDIPVDKLTEGIYALRYQTTNVENGTSDSSSAIRIEVDTTPPGRPQLGPIKLPPEVQDGLTITELEAMGNVLQVEIGSYTGMAKHDTIRTFWGSVEGAGATVTADDMGLKRVQIVFTREFLESLGNFDDSLSYEVTDRAGNVSAQSLGATVKLLLTETPKDFPAPIVDPAVGNLIDYMEAKSGVTINIPSYPGVAPFDQIILHWGASVMLPVTVAPGDENEDVVLSLVVPFETIALIPEGTVTINYDVVQNGSTLGSSLSSSIDSFLTLPGPVDISMPVIQGTSLTNPNIDDNFIDEDDYELNGRAIIKWKLGFAISDDLNLHWGQENITQWYQIKDTDISAARDLILSIPNTVIKQQGTGPEIPVKYSITRNGNPNPNVSPPQNVTVRSKEELPGGANGLDGPKFTTNSAGVVGPIENPNGAPAKINPYLNIDKDQNILFFFKAFDDNNNPIAEADFEGERELDAHDVVDGYSFVVPDVNLRRICIGYGEAFFKVVPAAGSNQSSVTSRTTRVRINMSRPATQCRAIF